MRTCVGFAPPPPPPLFLFSSLASLPDITRHTRVETGTRRICLGFAPSMKPERLSSTPRLATTCSSQRSSCCGGSTTITLSDCPLAAHHQNSVHAKLRGLKQGPLLALTFSVDNKWKILQRYPACLVFASMLGSVATTSKYTRALQAVKWRT